MNAETMPASPRRRGRPPSSGRTQAQAASGEARVEAVERALSLLEAFDGPPRLTLSELAARSGLYPSTVLRLAASLIRFGYLHREADGAFRLGPAPLRLGLRYQSAFNLAEQVRPALAALSAHSGETAGFYVREGEHRICLFRHHPDRAIRHHVEEGARLALDRGAGGRVLAAFGGGSGGAGEEALRERGFCISLGERDPEAAAVAAPVFASPAFAPGGFAGALGVAGARHRFDPANCDRLVALVVDAARALSFALGGVTAGGGPRGP